MQESGENYLETILILTNKNPYVRSIDIANELGYTKPSISRAMSILKKNNYITMDAGGQIELTDTGRERATQIYERHRLLTKCLLCLGVSEETAAGDACRIEHVISQETFDRLKGYMAKEKK